MNIPKSDIKQKERTGRNAKSSPSVQVDGLGRVKPIPTTNQKHLQLNKGCDQVA